MGILGAVIGVALLYFIGKALGVSMSILKTLLVNGITGAVILILFNLVGGLFGLNLDLNFLNAIVAGIFGIPGIIVLLLVANL